MLRTTVYMRETPDTAMQKSIFFRINLKVLFISELRCSVIITNNQ